MIAQAAYSHTQTAMLDQLGVAMYIIVFFFFLLRLVLVLLLLLLLLILLPARAPSSAELHRFMLWQPLAARKLVCSK